MEYGVKLIQSFYFVCRRKLEDSVIEQRLREVRDKEAELKERDNIQQVCVCVYKYTCLLLALYTNVFTDKITDEIPSIP